MKRILFLTAIFFSLSLSAGVRETIWPKGKMPHKQDHQIAAMTDESEKEDFNPDKNRVAYLEWFDAPAKEIANGGCMILISGGGYWHCCDVGLIKEWKEKFTKLGFQCVNFVYRTPRPEGLPIYQSAWIDGQRAIRMVRSQAAKRGFDPEKIGIISMSAGSHLGLLLATSSHPSIRKNRQDRRHLLPHQLGHHQRASILNNRQRHRHSKLTTRLWNGRSPKQDFQVR